MPPLKAELPLLQFAEARHRDGTERDVRSNKKERSLCGTAPFLRLVSVAVLLCPPDAGGVGLVVDGPPSGGDDVWNNAKTGIGQGINAPARNGSFSCPLISLFNNRQYNP